MRPGLAQGVGDRAGAVVARVAQLAVAAAVLVGLLGDLVARGDHVLHRLRGVRRARSRSRPRRRVASSPGASWVDPGSSSAESSGPRSAAAFRARASEGVTLPSTRRCLVALERAHALLGVRAELAVHVGLVAGVVERALQGLHVAARVPLAQGLVAEAGLGGGDGHGCEREGGHEDRAGVLHVWCFPSLSGACGVSCRARAERVRYAASAAIRPVALDGPVVPPLPGRWRLETRLGYIWQREKVAARCEHRVDHRLRELAGERVLLAGVEAADQQRPVLDPCSAPWPNFGLGLIDSSRQAASQA